MTQNDTTAPPVARIFVDEALTCARNAGIDVSTLLAGLGIPPRNLSNLTPEDFARIWLTVSVEMEDEFFGLGARPMRPGSTTLLGHAVHGAPTLGVALRRALRFLKVVLDEPYGLLERDKDICKIHLAEDGPPRSAFAYRTFFLILHGFTCWLARERVPLTHVRFPCPEPAEQNDYGEFFGVPVQFNQPAAQLAFEWRYLSRPARRSETDLKHFLRTTPESFLRGYRDTGSLRQQILDSCFSGPPEAWPSMDRIAAQLGMSRSTLHRRLRSTGQTLGDLKEDLKRRRAGELLTRSAMTIDQISAELGYAEQSAFYRAFRRWYGVTPSEFRCPD